MRSGVAPLVGWWWMAPLPPSAAAIAAAGKPVNLLKSRWLIDQRCVVPQR
jgi:hypothetical protein